MDKTTDLDPNALYAAAIVEADGCRARETLDLVADKWSLYVVSFLGAETKRFTELKRGINGISQRMLTVTLRALERDGILTRTVHEVMPPHVSYALTPLGVTLLAAAAPLIEWTCQNLDQIDKARADYDARAAAREATAAGTGATGR
jgi:DNA-binding HxlR family transcriptional regulator